MSCRPKAHMNIRCYSDSDLEAVVYLFTASVHGLPVDHYDAEQREAWAPTLPDLSAWDARLKGLTTLVAEIDGKLAGFISYEPNGHIDLLYTSPASPRIGVASDLLRHAEAELSCTGIDEVFTEASLAARPFFEREGFWVKEEQIVSLRGVQFLRYLMCKSKCAVQFVLLTDKGKG